MKLDLPTATLEEIPRRGEQQGVAFNRNWILELKRKGVLQVIDLNTGKTKDVKVKQAKGKKVRLAGDGKMLLTHIGEKECVLIEVRTGRKLRKWDGPVPQLGSDGVCFHRGNGEIVATSRKDKVLWRSPQRGAFEVSLDGRRLIGTNFLLDAATGEPVHVWPALTKPDNWEEPVVLAGDSDELFAIYFAKKVAKGKPKEGRLEFRSLETGEQIAETTLHGFHSVHAISPDGQAFVAIGERNSASLMVKTGSKE